MVLVFMLFAIPAWLLGLLFLSEATSGVGLIASAIFLGVLARIGQAAEQHREIKKLLQPKATDPITTP